MADSPLDTEKQTAWDHSSDPYFVDYYAEQSTSQATIQRFTQVRDKVLGLLRARNNGTDLGQTKVADIGCGTGTQARLWAALGHRAYGIDVNLPLIEIARERARAERLNIEFDVGSATELPYADCSMDVALLPELLEHVVNWQGCLDEAIRILKPGGILFVSTTNRLCPIQSEFNLPLYSWYPSFVKHHYERLAVTTRPEIANYCKYPAVNWFSYYSLAAYMSKRSARCLDRFDIIDDKELGTLSRLAVTLVRAIPLLRFIGQIMTSSSIVVAIKK